MFEDDQFSGDSSSTFSRVGKTFRFRQRQRCLESSNTLAGATEPPDASTFPSFLPLMQQCELNQQFSYEHEIPSIDFSQLLGDPITAGPFPDSGMAAMSDELNPRENSYLASPGPLFMSQPSDGAGTFTRYLDPLYSSSSGARTPESRASRSPAGPLRSPAHYPAYASPHASSASLPSPKESWTREQEEFLVAAKKRGCTFPQIRQAMYERFGVDRNPNILSKKYRAVIDRSVSYQETVSVSPVAFAPQSAAWPTNLQPCKVLDRALSNALPSMLQCLEEEMSKLSADDIDEKQYREIRRELRRKLPGFVRRLALGLSSGQ